VREAFKEIKFQDKTLAKIEQANAILAEYAAQGFIMTLRQLYYQFVARDLLVNELKSYKRLGAIMCDARDAGLVDWASIEDRTRERVTHASWDNPEDIIGEVARQYREDIWDGQSYRPEVWIEKAALLGVIEPICNEFRVPFFASIGNNSQTEQHKAGKRFAELSDQGLFPLVLHLGDHDPNGIDMTRDNTERLELYAGREVEVRRIALNIDQVRRYNPPPNFAKETDSRYAAYVEQFGTDCWELDALSPTVIADLIRVELNGMINVTAWKRRQNAEARNRTLLGKVAANWTKVKKAVTS
jgi:hypothetical protein